MKILHYIPSIDRTSGGVGTYMQLLTAELGKLVESYTGRITEKEFSECPQYTFYIDPFGVVQMIAVFCYVEFHVYRQTFLYSSTIS